MRENIKCYVIKDKNQIKESKVGGFKGGQNIWAGN